MQWSLPLLQRRRLEVDSQGRPGKPHNGDSGFDGEISVLQACRRGHRSSVFESSAVDADGMGALIGRR
jgi:hypothetical protein